MFDIEYREHNGKVFQLHWKYRYDPLTITALAVTAIGTVRQVRATRQAGRDAERIAEAQAAADIENAEAVREESVEQARIKREKGRKFLETQKSTAAAGNIRINVGVPLVIEAETNAEITKDIGFGLKRGRREADFFTSRAGITLASGKAAKKRAKSKALSRGLIGFGSIAFMGADAGMFSSKSIRTGVDKVVRGTKSFFGGAGKLNAGPKSLFDLNTGIPGAGRTIA